MKDYTYIYIFICRQHAAEGHTATPRRASLQGDIATPPQAMTPWGGVGASPSVREEQVNKRGTYCTDRMCPQ